MYEGIRTSYKHRSAPQDKKTVAKIMENRRLATTRSRCGQKVPKSHKQARSYRQDRVVSSGSANKYSLVRATEQFRFAKKRRRATFRQKNIAAKKRRRATFRQKNIAFNPIFLPCEQNTEGLL